MMNTYLWLYLCKRIKIFFFFNLLWGICGGHFLLWWEWHSLSHHYPNAHQRLKNPSLARKWPHWNGQITETTERIFSLLLPFVFSSFPKLLLQWGDPLMDEGEKERAEWFFWWVSSPQVLLRWLVCGAMEMFPCHPWHPQNLMCWIIPFFDPEMRLLRGIL